MGDSTHKPKELEQILRSVEATRAEVKRLRTQVSVLEKEVAHLKKRADVEIPEDVLMAISAAVSAYLGNKGKIKAVHFRRHRTWAMQGRQAVQSRVAPLQ